jgi:hypothetical protein
MFVAHILFLALIGLTPLLLFLDSVLIWGVIQLYAAGILALVAATIRPGEASHLLKVIRWPIVLAVLPLGWAIIQLLPLPVRGLSGSIWESAAAALDSPLLSSITIDPGLTVLAICYYSSIIAIGIAAAAVSVDRQRAENHILILGGATLFISLILIYRVEDLELFGKFALSSAKQTNVAGSGYGLLIFAAIFIMFIERYFVQRAQGDTLSDALISLALAISGFFVCLFALFAGGSLQGTIAAGCGLAVMTILYFIRRIGLSWRIGLITTAMAAGAVAIIIFANTQPSVTNYSLRYAADSTDEVISNSARIIDAVGISGSGAGTFDAVFRLYGSPANGRVLPATFASQVTIEMGRPATWIIVGSAVTLILICGAGIFSRGRDFFYPLTGVGIGVATLLLAFCDASLTNPATSILFACAVGLGLAQSASRSRQ